MIEVQLEDGSIVEFPDGTQPDTMKRAIQKQTVKAAAKKNLEGMSSFRKALYGAERSIDESAMGLKQAVVGLDPEEEKQLAIRREMEDQIPGSSVSRIAGDAIQFASPSKLALGAAAKAPQAAQFFTRALAGAGVGAAAGGAQATLDGESRVENAALGGLFGAGGQALGDTIGRGIEGFVKRSPAAQKMAERVRNRMTLGQSADRTTLGGRIASGFEERIQSLPLVGDIVRSARERGTNAWRDDLIEKVAPTGFKPTGETTREVMDDTSREFQKRYAAALRGKTVAPSRNFEVQVSNIVNNPRSGIERGKAQELAESVLRNYQSRFGAVAGPQTGATGIAAGPTGARNIAMSATDAKDFESFLASEARNYRKLAGNGSSPDAGKVADLFSDLERAWNANYYRQLGPSVRKPLKELDAKYAPFKTVERAAGARMNEGGAFTPQQLDEAVSNRTGRSRYARGQGMLQDEATDGKAVFGQRIPDSGTGERAAMGALALGAGSIDPTTAITTAIGIPLVTTGPGKRLMTGETAAQRIAQRLRANQASRASGLPGGIAIQDVLTEESERY